MRRRARWPASLITGVLLLGAALASPVAGASSLQSLQQKAHELGLAQTPVWKALLHYEANWLGSGVTSSVVTPWFFTAAGGRTDPGAELDATLAAFFNSREISARGAPAQCVFRARYRYLNRRLGFDPARAAAPACPKFKQWRAALDAASVSLVYPAAYPNSPASMFGHTLLRIDSGGRAGASELLSYAVNFAATTDDDHGLVFAYKGLVGGYTGVYGLFPYYDKVKEYAWIQSRDIWDYRVHLSQAQIRRLVAHLWELRQVRFDYYFLLKNCSYQLLALLEAARPGLALVEQFDWYAIPADTIRAVAAVPGLLGPAHFRPALATTLAAHAGALAAPRLQLAMALAEGRVSPQAARVAGLPPRARARVLEVAHDYLYTRYQGGALNRAVVRARARAILLVRSHIAVSSGFAPVPVPPVPPQAGHPTRRVGVAAIREGDSASLGVNLRLAYHDLLDPPGGYVGGAQIEFLELGLRLNPADDNLELDHVTLLEIVSISPRSALFQPVSWQFGTGLRQRPVAAPFHEDAHLGYYMQGGPGLAWGDIDEATLYTFILAAADANHGFERGYALAGGASVGLLATPTRGWQLRVEAGYLRNALGDSGHRGWISFAQQWHLLGNLHLRLELGWRGGARADTNRGILSLQSYF